MTTTNSYIVKPYFEKGNKKTLLALWHKCFKVQFTTTKKQSKKYFIEKLKDKLIY